MNVRTGVAAFTAAVIIAAQAGAETKIGNWTFEQVTDPLTDQVTARAFVEAPTGMLIVKCDKPGRGSVYVRLAPTTPTVLDGPNGPVDYRFDKLPPVEAYWFYFQDAASSRDWSEAKAFLSGLTQSSQLAARLTAFDQSKRDMAFDVSGADQAVASVERVCMN